jgi:hypothetical protein
MDDLSPERLNDDYRDSMRYAQVVKNLQDSNSFRSLVRDILLESIKSQDVQKAITDSLRDYAPFHSLIADSVAESKQKSTGKSFFRFFNFDLKEIITLIIAIAGLVWHFYPSGETFSRSDFIPLVESLKREISLALERNPDPKLEKDLVK